MSASNGKLSKAADQNGGVISGGLRGLLKGGKDYEKEAQKIVQALKEEFPFVAEILGGLPADATNEAVAPGTITITFMREEHVSRVMSRAVLRRFLGRLETL